MSGRPKAVRFEDVESEEFEVDFPLPNHQSNSVPLIEDLLYEIDVARYYKKVLNVPLPELSFKSPRPAKISRAVQTEPDVSGIPPSWLRTQCMLVDELYNNIGNLINSLFHSPCGFQGDVSEIQRLKFFEYVDGFWQSKYIPHVRIPASEIDRRIFSGSLKQDLKQLFECAEKLKNIVPVQANESSRHDPQRTERDESGKLQGSSSEKLKPAETASSCVNVPQPVASTSSKFSLYSDTVRSASSSNSSLSGKSVVITKDLSCRRKTSKQCGWGDAPSDSRDCVLPIPTNPACKSQEFAGEPMDTSESCGKVIRPISKSKVGNNRRGRPTPKQHSGYGSAAASRVVDQSFRPKADRHNGFDQQNKEQESCTRPIFSAAPKNFIKLNILALRESVIKPRANSGRAGYGRLNI